MASPYLPWLLAAVWLSVTILTLLALGVTAAPNWLLVTTAGIVPGAITLRLWRDRAPLARVADVLHVTDVPR